jgi:hypothetical protein
LYRGPFGEAFYPRPLAKTAAGFSEDWMTIMWNRPGRAAASAQASADPPPLRRAMEINRALLVMNLEGMYDSSCAAMDEAVARTDSVFRSRVTNRCYAGGHMMYSDLAARREMLHDFADFVRAGVAASQTRVP